MYITDKWTRERYLEYVIKNKLDNIWTGWCNPASVEGIRLAAYNPIFPADGNVDYFIRKCAKKGCPGSLTIPLDDVVRRVIYKRRCNGIVNESACGAYQTILYRWMGAGDKRKLYFENPEVVRFYGQMGRTFYATNILYKKPIVKSASSYVDEQLMTACTLTMDFDITSGTICETKNREMLDKGLGIVIDELSTFAGGSYNLQTSGNGAYLQMHHNLVTTDIFETMATFNAWIIKMNKKIHTLGVTGIKIDPINMPSRVFKLIGSIHQKLDLVCIPLDFDCKLAKMDTSSFKLKNFDIGKYIDTGTGKLKYYDRFDKNDINSLSDFLNTSYFILDKSGPRAVKAGIKAGVEAITGEEQAEDSTEDKNNSITIAEDFFEYYKEWKKLDAGIPGRVMYKRNTDGTVEVEMLGVDDDKAEDIMQKILNLKD